MYNTDMNLTLGACIATMLMDDRMQTAGKAGFSHENRSFEIFDLKSFLIAVQRLSKS